MGKRKGSSGPISKTKALAIRRKTEPTAVKTHGGTPKEILLAQMMEHHLMENDSVSFADIMQGLGMNDRNTKWRNAWRDLQKERHTQPSDGDENGPVFTSGFKLTQSGIGLAATDEYKSHVGTIKTTAKTEAEHHEQIKSKLINKRGEQIFDLLLEHGPKSRKELAALLGISDTGAYFSYALQQLKELEYAEMVAVPDSKGKKVKLTDKAFLKPRPTPDDVVKDDSERDEVVSGVS